MATFTALTILPDEATANALAGALDALDPAPTTIGVAEVVLGALAWEVSGYFSAAPDQAGLALLALLHGAPDFTVSELAERDWVAEAQRLLAPVAAGRFVVHGSHDRGRVGSQKIGLEIEAAMAFGTGHHATTKGCLLLLDRLARRGMVARRVADIGSGTGVLAMAAARLWPVQALASDIDPVATETAAANVAANGLRGRVRCLTAAGFRHPELMRNAPYDLILANILAVPLKRLAPDMARYLAPGGVAILSGILATQVAGVEAVYRGWGFGRVEKLVIGDWATLGLRVMAKAKPPHKRRFGQNSDM